MTIEGTTEGDDIIFAINEGVDSDSGIREHGGNGGTNIRENNGNGSSVIHEHDGNGSDVMYAQADNDSEIHEITEVQGAVPHEERVLGTELSEHPVLLVRRKIIGVFGETSIPQDITPQKVDSHQDVDLIRQELAKIKIDDSRDLADVIQEALSEDSDSFPSSRLRYDDESTTDKADATKVMPARWDWENLPYWNPDRDDCQGRDYADYVYTWDLIQRQAKVDWRIFARNADMKFSALEVKIFQEYQIFIQFLLRLHHVLKNRENSLSAFEKVATLSEQYRWGLRHIEKRNLARVQSTRKALYGDESKRELLEHPDLRSIVFSDAFGGLVEMVNEVLVYQKDHARDEHVTLMNPDIDGELDVLVELTQSFIKLSGSLQLWWVHEMRGMVSFPEVFAEKMNSYYTTLDRKFI